MKYKKSKISNAQEYGLLNRYFNAGHIGRGVSEWLFGDYKQIMNKLRTTDEEIRSVAVPLKRLIKEADSAFAAARYVDTLYWIGKVRGLLDRSVAQGKEGRDFLSKAYLKHISRSKEPGAAKEVDQEMKANAGVGDALRWMYRGIYGDPIQNVYKKHVAKTKGKIKAALELMKTVTDASLQAFSQMGDTRASGEVEQWIQAYDTLDEISKNFTKSFRELLQNDEIKILIKLSLESNQDTHAQEVANAAGVTGSEANASTPKNQNVPNAPEEEKAWNSEQEEDSQKANDRNHMDDTNYVGLNRRTKRTQAQHLIYLKDIPISEPDEYYGEGLIPDTFWLKFVLPIIMRAKDMVEQIKAAQEKNPHLKFNVPLKIKWGEGGPFTAVGLKKDNPGTLVAILYPADKLEFVFEATQRSQKEQGVGTYEQKVLIVPTIPIQELAGERPYTLLDMLQKNRKWRHQTEIHRRMNPEEYEGEEVGAGADESEDANKVMDVVIAHRHQKFFNLLKQASDMNDPFLMATMMAKYSKVIEEDDPELSIDLLFKAKAIVDEH